MDDAAEHMPVIDQTRVGLVFGHKGSVSLQTLSGSRNAAAKVRHLHVSRQ